MRAPITLEDLKGMDLEALEREIQELEGNLELHIRKAQAEIDGRKQLLRVIDVLKNGKKPRQKRSPKPKASPAAAPPQNGETPPGGLENARLVSPRSAEREARLDRIEAHLTRVGNATMKEISEALGIPIGSMGGYMSDPRFIKTDEGYRVD